MHLDPYEYDSLLRIDAAAVLIREFAMWLWHEEAFEVSVPGTEELSVV